MAWRPAYGCDVAGDELGISIIGSGYMGRTYAECVTRYVKGARLIGVSGSRAPGLVADYEVNCEPDIQTLLDVGHVRLDPTLGDDQAVGHFGARASVRGQPRDLTLPLGTG